MTGGGVRAAGLTLVCVLLTSAGHVAGGGSLPDLALLAVLGPLVGVVLVGLADRAQTPVGLLAVLGGGQLVLHHLLELLHPVHVGGPAPLGGAGMVAMHVAATVLLAGAVRGADVTVAAVVAAVRRVLPRRPRAASAHRPLRVARPAGAATGLRLATALCSAEARRGPPVRC